MARSHLALPLVLAAVGVAACSRSLASFEGEITMHTTDSHGAAHDLLIETKGGQLRFDASGAGGKPVHAVFDPAKNRVVLYVDTEQTYFDLDFAKPSAKPSTDPQSATAAKSSSPSSETQASRRARKSAIPRQSSGGQEALPSTQWG